MNSDAPTPALAERAEREQSPSRVIGVDVGGTFTDVCLHDPDTGEIIYHKLPSTPGQSHRAILDGVAQLCAAHDIDPVSVHRVAHGTTVATNALIEGRGGRVALIVTEGFRDLLEIGRQVRPKIYDLQADYPAPLVPRKLRFEVRERVTSGGRIVTPLTDEEIARVVDQVKAAKPDAVAVCTLFSYIYPDHERRIGEALARELPGVDISLSCEVRPEFREYERLSTTVLNAYLQPVMSDYMMTLDEGIRDMTAGASLGINQSSGGLISAQRAREFPIRTALSGPAAGVAGAIQIAKLAGEPNLITLDIGGTSSDVALIAGHRAGTVQQRWIEGYPARITSVDIDAIGAGGGSVAWMDHDGLLKVGPRSAGAFPGPVCYGRGGTEPTVSDANLLLGRLSPGGLLSGTMPLDTEGARTAVGKLAERAGLAGEWMALGIIDIAVGNMVRGIRAISVERGLDPRDYTLFAFGGAGPLHASSVARTMGIRRIMVPAHPGLLCAQGLIVADQLEYFVKSIRAPLDDNLAGTALAAIGELEGRAQEWFDLQEIEPEDRRITASLEMRYVGQNFELSIKLDDKVVPEIATLEALFAQAHTDAYGFHNASARVEIVGVTLAASGVHRHNICPNLPKAAAGDIPAPKSTRQVWYDRSGAVEARIYDKADLLAGHRITGPAIIDQLDTTTVIFPGDEAIIDGHGNILITVNS